MVVASCIVEEHKTGFKGILELRSFRAGYTWIFNDREIPGTQPQPTAAEAKRNLQEAIGQTHLITWQKKKKPERKQLQVKLDTSLHFEIATLANLHKISSGEMIRRILLDYLRPGAPAPLPPISREYLQGLLEPYRGEKATMVTKHCQVYRKAKPAPRKK